MKKCPKCQKTFDDDQNFCFDDASQLVSVGEADTPTMFVPNESPPPTQMVNPQQMQNWQQPIANPNLPSGFNPPPGFNPQPFTPSAQNQPMVAGGNIVAWIGLALALTALILSAIAAGTESSENLGKCFYNTEFCSRGKLAFLTIFLTGAAFLCGVAALILSFVNPQKFSRKIILSLSVGLIAGLAFLLQFVIAYDKYSILSRYSSSNSNSNRSNSSNSSNVNKTPTPSPTPLSLDKAILGKWREDGSVSTITFYADNSMLIDNAGKRNTGTYQIISANKVAFLKNGVKFKESTISVTDSKMTMDGASLTKVD